MPDESSTMPDPTPPPKRTRRRAASPAAAPDAETAPTADVPGLIPDVAGQTVTAPAVAAAPAAIASNPPTTARSVLHLQRGGIGEATADEVHVQVGGIGALQAEEAHVQLGGIGAARGGRIDVRVGSVGAALASELHVAQGVAGSVAARQVSVEQSLVRTLVARDVELRGPTGVLVLLAARVTGDVRPVLDWRGALVFGLAFGLVSALVARARKA